MGFFYNLQKKKLIQYPKAIWRVQHSNDIFLKKFVYTSVSMTNLFFDNFLNLKAEYSYLNRYKNHLNTDSVARIFRLFALQDFKSFNDRLRANNTKADNEAEYEQKIQLSFDCTEQDKEIYKKLKTTTSNYSETFTKVFFEDCLRVFIPLGEVELNIFRDVVLNRTLNFSDLLFVALKK